MIKPQRLVAGDTIALVSLSTGMAGDDLYHHRYELGKKRLEDVFGLKVKIMVNALKGSEFLDNHPEARAADLMAAFADNEVKGIFTMYGGDDTIRLLPWIDFEVIQANPKIFLGYSDTTSNHFMMQKAGVMSYYGPSVLAEFAENVQLHDYTENAIRQTLFEPRTELTITSSDYWTATQLDWADEKNNLIRRSLTKESRGYDLIQGQGLVSGELLGGCLDVFPMVMGTKIWPAPAEWENKLLFIESSEEQPEPSSIKYLLRGLVAQGVIEKINGIVVGKPYGEKFYDEYRNVYQQVIGKEAGRPDLPILANLNFGHNAPMCVLPYGVKAEINCLTKEFSLLEMATN